MLYFSIQNGRQDRTGKVSEAAGARWQFYRRISSDIVGCPRIILESSLYWRKQFRDFALQSGTQNFVAGAVFGEVGGWLCLLRALEMTFHMWCGALMRFILCGRRSIWWSVECDFSWQAQHFVTFWEIAGARNVVFFNTKWSPRSHGEGLRSGGCEMTILSSDIGYSDIVGNVLGCSNRLSIGGSNSGILRWNHELRISWQAQYLVRLEGGFACCAHWKWRFICDAEHWCDSFCVAGAVFGEAGVWLFVAGAVFGEGGVWLFVAGAALRDILGDSRSAKCCIFQYKIVAKIARGRSPKRRVRDDNFIVG